MSPSLQPQKTDLKELQAQQLEANGDFSASQEEKVTGNMDDSYELPKHAAHRIHLRLTTKENDPVKKEYVEKSHVVELAPSEYTRMVANASFAGYDKQELLHDPRPKAERKADDEQAAKTNVDPTKRPAPRTKADWQARYKELYQEEAPDDKTVDQLKEAVAYKENENHSS